MIQKRLDCSKLTEETKDLMFSLIDESNKKNREHAIALCEDKNGKIVHSNICIGTECLMPIAEMMKLRCPAGTKEISSFHTHHRHGRAPGGFDPSPDDIVSSASKDQESFCYGFSFTDENAIICYNIKDRQLLELGNSAQKLAQKGEIKGAKEEVPKMFDRLRNLGYPEKAKDIIEIECFLTKTKK